MKHDRMSLNLNPRVILTRLDPGILGKILKNTNEIKVEVKVEESQVADIDFHHVELFEDHEMVKKEDSIKEEVEDPAIPKIEVIQYVKTERENDNHQVHAKKSRKPSKFHSGSLKCEDCYLEFSDKNKLYRHRNKVHLRRFVCDLCKEPFGDSVQLRRHEKLCKGITNPNPDNLPFICKICQGGYSTLHKLQNHRRKVHTDRNYSCDLCEEKFKLSFHLKRHQARKHYGGKFSCEIDGCAQEFLKLSLLYEHQRKAHPHMKNSRHTPIYCRYFTEIEDGNEDGSKKVKCDLCKKILKHWKAAQSHFTTNHQPKMFECDECGKKFATIRDSVVHKGRVHKRGKGKSESDIIVKTEKE